MGFKLRGGREFKAALTAKSLIAREAGNRALRRVGGQILEGSQDRAPEKSGQLVESHELVTTGRGDSYRVEVQVTAPHALPMHEGIIPGDQYGLGPISLDKNAGRRPHVGEGVGWKFLERSFNANYREALRQVQEALSGVFGRGKR